MLNRSLYEDMAIAHWVKRHREEASSQFEKNEKLIYGRWGEQLGKHDAPLDLSGYPKLSDEERKELGGEFRAKTWTGLNLHELTTDIEPEWRNENDRRLLWQTHDLVHGFNNLLLHQTPVSLGLVAHAGEEGVEFDVGPSDMHIRAALFGAFWPYSQTVSLVLTGAAQDELQRLYTEHLPAFTTERSVE